MKVNSSEFIISAVSPSQYPDDGRPQIALAGRSNVGKSSLINKLINRKNLARTSSKPGKTQTLNYYLINDSFYFVDVPGYGYAKVSKKEKQKWAKMLETFFAENKNVRGAIQLIDFRHPPTASDLQMYEFLAYFGFPIVIAATKLDKVPRSKRVKHQKKILTELDPDPRDPLILFSAETGEGKAEMWSEIGKLLK